MLNLAIGIHCSIIKRFCVKTSDRLYSTFLLLFYLKEEKNPYMYIFLMHYFFIIVLIKNKNIVYEC